MSDVKDNIINLLEEAKKRGRIKKTGSSKKEYKESPAHHQSVIGNGNIVAGRDVNINKREIKRVTLEPSPEYITPAQKQTIKEKIAKLVEIGVIAGGEKDKFFAQWWNRLQKRFRVNSYHELHQSQYDEVIKWINQQKALNRPKLRRRDNQAWRNDLYSAIYAKARQLKQPKEWVYLVVQERLGKVVESLIELGEQDLKRLYDIIIRMHP